MPLTGPWSPHYASPAAGCAGCVHWSCAPTWRSSVVVPSRPVTMMAPAVDGTGGHGCFPATNTSPAPEHRAAAISPAGCAPTSPGQDHPTQDLDAWADVDTGLQHVHVKGEDDPLRRLGDEDLLDGDWAAARPCGFSVRDAKGQRGERRSTERRCSVRWTDAMSCILAARPRAAAVATPFVLLVRR